MNQTKVNLDKSRQNVTEPKTGVEDIHKTNPSVQGASQSRTRGYSRN